MTFDDFELNDDLLDGIYSMNFREPTPIQAQAIPAILDGKDLIACAQTGTGKTAAFLLPIMDQIHMSDYDGTETHTIIVVPTRELALQIDYQIQGLSYYTPVTSIAVYGGDSSTFSNQRNALKTGVDIIVATPGKLLSHLNIGANVSKVRNLILDEADRMLDMGFYEDILQIASHLPKVRQNVFFSATMPPKIRTLAKKLLHNPVEITIAISKTSKNVTQKAFLVYENQKNLMVDFLVQQENYESVIIFTSTKSKVKEITDALTKRGLSVEGISSDLDQKEREDVLLRFKGQQTKILVGTDIISRGIDVDTVELVINFDVPKDPEDYVHRVGRTARASRKGEAITFINENPKEQQSFAKIENLIQLEVEKPRNPPFLGPGPAYNPILKRNNNRKNFHGKKKNFNYNNSGGNNSNSKKKYYKKPFKKGPNRNNGN
ncbi:DEAD/DEAH box helicase [Flammeovirga aprica]|uniref:DEAD/DEAH box helicase n=1 Tax=Flammeovirga aprica JL-4 TaxID=694437 RepID=A0A7X9P056_9BACT|nr:DEAD/DEAH box helicase [Flammeovirga aprica]NME67116.1 DEAD/DEAH box helicase [Flammeovirga aprica JL-4]